MAVRVARVLREGPLRVQDDTLALGVPLHVCEHIMQFLADSATPQQPPPAAVVKVPVALLCAVKKKKSSPE